MLSRGFDGVRRAASATKGTVRRDAAPQAVGRNRPSSEPRVARATHRRERIPISIVEGRGRRCTRRAHPPRPHAPTKLGVGAPSRRHPGGPRRVERPPGMRIPGGRSPCAGLRARPGVSTPGAGVSVPGCVALRRRRWGQSAGVLAASGGREGPTICRGSPAVKAGPQAQPRPPGLAYPRPRTTSRTSLQVGNIRPLRRLYSSTARRNSTSSAE